MSTQFHTLFEASCIGALNIPNKLAVAPMTRVSASADGTVGPLMQEYYERFAEGGFGLIVTEGLYTDERYSQGYRNQPGLATEVQGESWATLVDGIHSKGALVVAQLMHAGALSQYNPFVNKTIGPSAVPPMGTQMPFYEGDGPYRTPEAMTAVDITEVIEGFTNAAKRAKAVGFDGVEIHGANGYLLDQFLTSYTNVREDAYGGCLANRLRLYKDVLEAVRTAVGEDFIVGIRFSQKKVNDTEYVWGDAEIAAEKAFGLVRDCGADYIHTTEPMLSEAAFEGSTSLAALAKKYSGLPVIANGGVTDPELASSMIDNNHADVIALGKIALANQDYPRLVKSGSALKPFSFEMLSPMANLECANHFFESIENQ